MMDKGGPSVEATVNEMHKEESSGNPSPEMREVNECPMGLSSISSDNPQCFPLCVWYPGQTEIREMQRQWRIYAWCSTYCLSVGKCLLNETLSKLMKVPCKLVTLSSQKKCCFKKK